MQGYNVILVFSPDKEKILLCKRKKDPYKGLSNLVDGKIETGEDGLAAAYRELFEETGIQENLLTLRHLMDFTYYYEGCYVEAYVGRLREDFCVFGEENDLYWSSLAHNFFDMTKYAGEGTIGTILERVWLYESELLCD